MGSYLFAIIPPGQGKELANLDGELYEGVYFVPFFELLPAFDYDFNGFGVSIYGSIQKYSIVLDIDRFIS